MENLIESCRISPPPMTVADRSLPLTFLDLNWLHFHPIRRILFYQLQDCSKKKFLETLVPELKESLSLTLKHFFCLAGNIIYPFNLAKKPQIRYEAGDSVSMTFVESAQDFDDLVGNHPRDADKLYDFVPLLSNFTDEENDQRVFEVLAIRVTFFPGRGVCIGFSNNHAVGDASSIVEFINFWALINKHGQDYELLLDSKSFPVFDRSLIKYPHELDSLFLKQIQRRPLGSASFPVPTNRVRATYVLSVSDIKELKKRADTGVGHVSSFVVATAYVWHCLAKAMLVEEVVVEDDDPEFFLFAIDARARMNPAVPGNYFGNCLTYGLAGLKHRELVGEEGFSAAAEAIAEEIKSRVVNNGGDIIGDAENWSAQVGHAVQKSIFSVSGSARADFYGVDFGWGGARKLEALSIDGERYAMSLCRSRDGGLELGLSLPNLIMDAFAAFFPLSNS